MFFIIFVALDRQNCVDVMTFKDLKVFFSFWVRANKNIRSYLRELEFVDAAFINNDDVSSRIYNFSAAGIGGILMIEIENSSRFSFSLKEICFSQIVVIKLLLKSKNFKTEGPYLILILGVLF